MFLDVFKFQTSGTRMLCWRVGQHGVFKMQMLRPLQLQWDLSVSQRLCGDGGTFPYTCLLPILSFSRQYIFFPSKMRQKHLTEKLNLFSDREILQRFGDRCPARNKPLLAVKRSCSPICRRLVPCSCLCPSLSSPPGNGILFNKMEVPGDFLLNSHDLSK